MFPFKKDDNDLNKYYMREGLLTTVLISLIVGGVAGGIVGATVSGSFRYFPQYTDNKQVQTSPQTKTLKVEEESQTIDTVKKVSPAVVSIVIKADLSKYYQNDPFNFWYGNSQSAPQGKQTIGGGSGFIISADGMILTNKHVVDQEGVEYTVVTNDGKQYPANVLARDPSNDIAIVKIEAANLPVAELGDSDALQIGQTVIAIGNSLAQYQNTVTKGVVSGLARNITAGGGGASERLEDVIQTDAAINPGNSGGPLVNLGGQVVGVNTAIDQEGQLVGFSIPINSVKSVIESVKKTGKIARPFIGIRYSPITKQFAQVNNLPFEYGIYIVRGSRSEDSAIVKDSPADKAGLKEGDIILEINGVKINEDHSLVGQLAKYSAGDEITLKISSSGTIKDIKVKLEERKE